MNCLPFSTNHRLHNLTPGLTNGPHNVCRPVVPNSVLQKKYMGIFRKISVYFLFSRYHSIASRFCQPSLSSDLRDSDDQIDSKYLWQANLNMDSRKETSKQSHITASCEVTWGPRSKRGTAFELTNMKFWACINSLATLPFPVFLVPTLLKCIFFLSQWSRVLGNLDLTKSHGISSFIVKQFCVQKKEVGNRMKMGRWAPDHHESPNCWHLTLDHLFSWWLSVVHSHFEREPCEIPLWAASERWILPSLKWLDSVPAKPRSWRDAEWQCIGNILVSMFIQNKGQFQFTL